MMEFSRVFLAGCAFLIAFPGFLQGNSLPQPLEFIEIATRPLTAGASPEITDSDLEGGVSVKIRARRWSHGAGIGMVGRDQLDSLWYFLGHAEYDPISGDWTCHSLDLARLAARSKRIHLRIIVHSGRGGQAMSLDEWGKLARLSEPLEVIIASRSDPGLSSDGARITIDRIDDSIPAGRPLLVSRELSLKGSVTLPGDRGGEPACVQVVAKSRGAQAWIFSPCVGPIGGGWTFPGFDLAGLGDPALLDYTVFAIVSRKGVRPGRGVYPPRFGQILAESRHIALLVDGPPSIRDEASLADVRIDSVFLRDGRKVATTQSKRIMPGNVSELAGSVERLPAGARIYVVVVHDSSGSWFVLDGSANIRAGKWLHPNPYFVPPNRWRGGTFRYLAIVSSALLRPGISTYQDIRENVLAMSASLAMEGEDARPEPEFHASLALLRVNGAKVKTEAALAGSRGLELEGQDEGIREEVEIRALWRINGDTAWTLGMPAAAAYGTWRTHLDPVDRCDMEHECGIEMLVVALSGHPLPETGRLDQWSPYLEASSPMYSFILESKRSIARRKPMKSLSIVLAAALLLALAILFSLLKKKLGLGSFSAVVEEESAAILRRMKGLIAPPQRIDPGLSFIALVTASLAVSVVVFCLPTYSHIAGFTLNFPPLVARRFAYLMLVLVAILGIAFHVFQLVGFGGRDDGKAGARTGSYDWVPQLIIIVLLGMQATFTSILYNAYYSRTSPGNQVLVAGMTTLAFIGTWAESIASYVTFRLGRPLFAWIFTLVMLLPGLVLHFLAQAWQRIFHRKSVQAVSPDLEAGPGSGSTNGHLGHRHAQVLEKIIVAGRKPGKENTK